MEIEKLMQRLATLEKEVQGHRARTPDQPTFDRDAFIRDPFSFMQKNGIPTDHVTRVMVATTLGDKAPPELQALAQMGPQYSATQALQAQVEALSRQLQTLTASQTVQGKRESFKALSSEASKYPSLSKVLKADPGFLDRELESFGGSAEEFVKEQEAKYAKLFPPPTASVANADTTTDQSKQVQPAVAALLNGEVPPIPDKPVGLFTATDHEKLRDEVVRKAQAAVAQ